MIFVFSIVNLLITTIAMLLILYSLGINTSDPRAQKNLEYRIKISALILSTYIIIMFLKDLLPSFSLLYLSLNVVVFKYLRWR